MYQKLPFLAIYVAKKKNNYDKHGLAHISIAKQHWQLWLSQTNWLWRNETSKKLLSIGDIKDYQ